MVLAEEKYRQKDQEFKVILSYLASQPEIREIPSQKESGKEEV